MQNPKLPFKWAITIILLTLTLLAWTRHLDHAAHTATAENFQRALTVAALARAFNGVISVAQGTEVAIQPVGVGVTLTIGEVLDPLNDLVERFSALALLDSAALGLQLALGQMVTSLWLSGLLSIAVMMYLITLWHQPQAEDSDRAPLLRTQLWLKILSALLFLRFALIIMLLSTHVLDQAFLVAKQDAAMEGLSNASSSIQQLQDSERTITDVPQPKGFLDRTAQQIRDVFDASDRTLDLKSQLNEVQARIEESVEDIINLIVIFILQTLLLPLAIFWLCTWVLRSYWRRSL